jgi:hypothetical protein
MSIDLAGSYHDSPEQNSILAEFSPEYRPATFTWIEVSNRIYVLKRPGQ